ncbi:hypothetical protein [Methermicoccus shengliensis]|uniref:Uncharacterized protein n=1 Tax=Methermicoccus shengliensis TaxID=660064 RepID=A0A832RSQ6_9EURY|nr:hypothetical protein [Methermicoccus shengliensis]KUK04737.1 MAG: hypothetical protein XD46_0574 [Euryarchaeota archaeon 55_53]KUK29819.1 MAG: hypothetical protein XD62_1088 [Methanosarcinales archeaon 56_1174]MDI3487403.1 hypothetical protein [Methanosarcinales archaeon]MDN5295268.1 hypothetical protein [Methanosarcinales archaeon]HIH69643.1 hypothetical protein [Methermicoccus shengliensis]
MDELLISDKKKIELLKTLSDGKVYTYYNLSKTLRTNYETVKKNCKFLELLNLVEVNKVEREESATGIASYRVKITKEGMRVVQSLH